MNFISINYTMDNNPIREYYTAMKNFDQYIEKENKKTETPYNQC